MMAYCVSVGFISYQNGGRTTNVSIYSDYKFALERFLKAVIFANENPESDYERDSSDESDDEEECNGCYKCACDVDPVTYHFDTSMVEMSSDVFTLKQYFDNVEKNKFKCERCKDDIHIYDHSLKYLADTLKDNGCYGGTWECGRSIKINPVKMNLESAEICNIYDLRN